MSRLFEALQNARHDVTEKYETRDDRVPSADTTRPVVRINHEQSDRYVNLFKAIRDLKKPLDACLIALSSPRGGEGTTTVVRQLADFIATQAGGKILIVECIVNSSPDVPPKYITVASGNSTGKSVDAASLYYDESKASYRCEMRTNDADLGNLSGDLLTIVAQIRPRYDWVIVDCRPILGPDANNELMRLVDGIALVVESESSKVKDVVSASNNLKLTDTKLLGVVLNKQSNYFPTLLRRFLNRFGFE